jgi:hypothetical protein
MQVYFKEAYSLQHIYGFNQREIEKFGKGPHTVLDKEGLPEYSTLLVNLRINSDSKYRPGEIVRFIWDRFELAHVELVELEEML